MKLPAAIREQFRRHGAEGGRRRAARMSAGARSGVARRGATARWVRERFGASTFAELGFPGGAAADAGLADLASRTTTIESLLVSIAAPRLRREGIPVARTDNDPEERLFDLISQDNRELAHARYTAHLRQMSSFADACRAARERRLRAS